MSKDKTIIQQGVPRDASILEHGESSGAISVLL